MAALFYVRLQLGCVFRSNLVLERVKVKFGIPYFRYCKNFMNSWMWSLFFAAVTGIEKRVHSFMPVMNGIYVCYLSSFWIWWYKSLFSFIRIWRIVDIVLCHDWRSVPFITVLGASGFGSTLSSSRINFCCW